MCARYAGIDFEEGQDMDDVKVIVGGSIEDDGAAFVDAWRRAERGETVHERVLAFESWEGLAQVMTGERYRLLRHLHGHPEPSVSALARALGRQYRRVHAEVAALEQVGLVGRSDGVVRAMADRIGVEIRL
jgi:predicted transcriptional regulator